MRQRTQEAEVKKTNQVQTVEDKELKALAEKHQGPRYDNFKSAQELSLTEEQWDALIKTLKFIEEGNTLHIDKYQDASNKTVLYAKAKRGEIIIFNMGSWGGTCGSVCCLGGSAEALAGKQLFTRDRWGDLISRGAPAQLNELFFHGAGVSSKTTEMQAAKALRGYLETGITNWGKALKG